MSFGTDINIMNGLLIQLGCVLDVRSLSSRDGYRGELTSSCMVVILSIGFTIVF